MNNTVATMTNSTLHNNTYPYMQLETNTSLVRVPFFMNKRK